MSSPQLTTPPTASTSDQTQPLTPYTDGLATIAQFKVGDPMKDSVVQGSNLWSVESTEPVIIHDEKHDVVRGIIIDAKGLGAIEWYKKQDNFVIQSYVVTSEKGNPVERKDEIIRIFKAFSELIKHNMHWGGDFWPAETMSSLGMYLSKTRR
jgi:hypothetical protein